MSIKLVTLKTAQTLIGNIVLTSSGNLEVTGGFFKIKSPVQVVVQPTKDGPIMGFIPFLEYSDEWEKGIQIKMEDVLTVNTPVSELANQYNKNFGSNIEIVSSMPQILKSK